jgi:hypothetical protein
LFNNTEVFALSWWLALVGALLLSVMGAYLTRAIDFILSLVSSKWKIRAQRRREKFEALVDRYMNDHQLTALAGFEMVLYTLRPMLSIILLGVMVVMYLQLNPSNNPYASSFMLGLIILSGLSIFLDMLSSIKFLRIVRAVHSRRLEFDANATPPV